MASDDDLQALDTHHDEKDWESQKENFRICYIDDGMTRKEAAEYMKEHFNFSATPRQWERKIKQWGFSKYANREERLHQIAQTGKTVYDVSRPGRRPRSHVDERGNLQPHEDRNLRRFARRELSRSRSRSRSASFTDMPRPQFKQEFSDPSANASMESPFNFNQLGLEMQRSSSNDGFHMASTQSGSGLQTFQPQIFQGHEPGAYGTSANPNNLPLSVGHSQWGQTQADGTHRFGAVGAQTNYTVFPDDPTSSQTPPVGGVPNGNQCFSVSANDPTFGFPITEPSVPSLSADFSQYVMAGTDMAMAPVMLPEDMMTEQSGFNNTIPVPLGSETLNQTGFDNNPGIQFAVVDVDSTPMLAAADAAPLHPSLGIDDLFLEPGTGNDGPLQNDVLPLVEDYTRAVQAAALGFMNRSSHDNSMAAGDLAADLVQPSRAFLANMAVILDNFAKSQQRSLQSMKDTCRNLRQKNARLMQFINSKTAQQTSFKMLVILWDPDTLLHKTVELLGSNLIPALESPERLEAILKALHHSEYRSCTKQISSVREGPNPRLLRLTSETHGLEYLQHLRDVYEEWLSAGLIDRDGHVLPECFVFPTSTRKPLRAPKDPFARAGYYAFDMSSGIMSESYRAIVASANLACEGADMLSSFDNGLPNDIDTVVALCRPPGHHCDGQRAGGYCYINNAALAVSSWRSHQPNAQIGILDIDFHHGNGTQEIFYADAKVIYVSIHGKDEFPYYTGEEDETGIDEGQNMNINLPLKVGCSIEEYLTKLEYGLKKLVEFKTEFLIVSLGFDTFHADPLGHFQIHTEDYETIARTTRQVLKTVPALVLLEGGYVIEHLGANMLSFLKGWNSA
ncbi:hypothetical protein AYO20_05431 [Fonsecaea nubica]|uniref:Clr5 domain-containing protein n=1 Tax=Fonsecaea nubica TaxID=856822 RepID=A0A178CZQ7_9EURO|nr:hypothetical protein AYO20_05431 [Fonsecaea nubica]OAL35380.1 hypothetical protein AYO20_05431 [Fonsecaea nubica]